MDMTEYENMINDRMYDPLDDYLVKSRQNARKLTRLFNQTTEEDGKYRKQLLKELLGKTGDKIYIEPSLKVDYGINIEVGENFYMNYDCVILDGARVKIGDNCMIAPKVQIYTAYHPLNADERNSGRELAAPITIGDNVWIGGGAIINPGITIGNNVVIASGAVVTKDFQDDVVIGGNPAKIIKKIDN